MIKCTYCQGQRHKCVEVCLIMQGDCAANEVQMPRYFWDTALSLKNDAAMLFDREFLESPSPVIPAVPCALLYGADRARRPRASGAELQGWHGTAPRSTD